MHFDRKLAEHFIGLSVAKLIQNSRKIFAISQYPKCIIEALFLEQVKARKLAKKFDENFATPTGKSLRKLSYDLSQQLMKKLSEVESFLKKKNFLGHFILYFNCLPTLKGCCFFCDGIAKKGLAAL